MNRKVKNSKMSIQDDPIPEHTSSDDGNPHIDITTAPMPTSENTANIATVTDVDADDEEDIEQKSDSNVNDHKRRENDDHMDFLENDDKGNFNIRCVGAAFQVCNSFNKKKKIISFVRFSSFKLAFGIFILTMNFRFHFRIFFFCCHSGHRDHCVCLLWHLN